MGGIRHKGDRPYGIADYLMKDFSVVIQAGGQSTRMGQDKAFLPFQATTMIEFILGQAANRGIETLIIANDPERYMQLGYPVYSDVIADKGALGGIYSGLHYSANDLCLMLACDMPFINLGLIDYMSEQVDGHDAVVPRLKMEEYAEPFRGFYRKSCLQELEMALNEGEMRISAFLERIKVRYVEREEIHRFDPDEISFMNVNSREDLIEAQALAEKLFG